MSKTGVYKYDPEKGEVVKVSDRIRSLPTFDCYCPPGGYDSENLCERGKIHIRSRTHKREILKKLGLREKGY